MAKRISSSDIFDQEDIFKGIRDSAEQTIKMMNALRKEVEGTANDLKKSIGGAKFDSVKAIENVVKVQEKSNKLTKEAIQIDKMKSDADKKRITAIRELEKLEQDKLNTESKSIRNQEQKAKQQERINKQREKAIKQAKDEANAYKKLEKKTRELKNQSKQLGAEMLLLEQSGKKNTAQYKKLEQQYRAVTKSAQAGDKQLKKLDKTVGDNFRNVGNYTGALATLKSGLGQLGLVFGVGQAFRTGGEAIIEFNQAVADLSAITGASGEDLEYYKEQANELGMRVEGGASAVVEAYKLIGSAKPELLSNARALNELTKASITLSEASGLALPEASKRLTDAMNQFGASADEAGKFIDVLASGAKFGSAEIPQITEALLKFGAIAKSTNVSIQESTGAIELLAEKGLKGAEAGTKLRNVMLKLSAPDALPKEAKDIMEELGISFEDLQDKSKPFEERLEALKPLLDNTTGLVKVFGTENEVAGQILLENTDRLAELTQQMDTNGVAQEQANKRTNTLGNALMKLKNAFLGLFTQIASGDGALQGVIDTLKWVATNLPQIITILLKLVRTYVLYKATLIAVNKIQYLYNGGLNDIAKSLLKNIKGTRAYRLEQIKANRATKDATKATSGFGQSMKSIGFMALIGLVSELAIRWYDVASGARNARMEAEAYAKAQEKASEKVGKTMQYWRDIERDEMLEIDLELAEGRITEERAMEKRIITKKQLINQLKNESSERQKDLNIVKQYAKELQGFEAQIKAGTMDGAKWKKQQQAVDNLNTALLNLGFDGGYETGTLFWSNLVGEATPVEQLMVKVKGATKQVAQETAEYNKEIENLGREQKELQIQQTENNKGFKNFAGSLSDVEKGTDKVNTSFSKMNRYISEQIDLLQQLKEIEQDRRLLAKDKTIEEEYKRQLKSIRETGEFDATILNKLIEDRVNAEKQIIDQRVQYEQNAIDRQYEREKQQRETALEDKYKALIKGAKGNAEAIAEINDNYEVEQKKLEADEVKRTEDNRLKKKAIYEQGVNDKLEAEKTGFDSIKDMNDNLTEELKKTTDDTMKERFQRIDDFVKASADFFIKQSNRKIEQLNKEIGEAQKQADFFRELAVQGNIDAEQSLAEQQRIINEANKKKLAEEKKQQRIRLAESVFNTYNQKVQQDSENPLAETIRDVSLLYQFINTLPGFFDGTEDTGKHGEGVDGRGGFHAILHPNERVIPKSLNDQLQGLSNEELTKIAVDYQNGVVIEGASQTASALELALVVNGLKEIKNEIRNKPETSIELGEITSSLMEVVKTSKKGNSVVYNRYKIRK